MILFAVQLVIKGKKTTLASSSSYQNAEWLYNALKALHQMGVLKVDKILLGEITE